MKKIGVKKLAAIAAGAALLGTAIAPFALAAVSDLTKSDIYDATTGSPVVNIVVGASAKASDIVWAGNIAAKIAEKATTTKEVSKTSTGTADTSAAEVKVVVGGTTTISGGARELITATLDSTANTKEYTDTVGSAYFKTFKNESKNVTKDNNTTTHTETETVGVQVNVAFDKTHTDIKDLVAVINANDLNYAAVFSPALPTTQSFTDTGSDDYIPVSFLGKNYIVDAVTTNQITLVTDNSEKSFTVGDKIAAIGKDGQNYTVEVKGGGNNGTANIAMLELQDSNGTVLVASTSYTTGDIVFRVNGVDQLQTKLNLKTITKSTVSSSDVYTFTMLVGADRLILRDGQRFPYDPNNTTGNYPWISSLTINSTGISTMAIKNSAKQWDTTNPIYSEKYSFNATGKTLKAGIFEGSGVDSIGYVKFKGFYDTGVQMTGVQILGGSNVANISGLTSYGAIKYTDSGGISHAIPMAVKLSSTNKGTGSFKFEGRDYVYAFGYGPSGNTGSTDANSQVFLLDTGTTPISNLTTSSNSDIDMTNYILGESAYGGDGGTVDVNVYFGVDTTTTNAWNSTGDINTGTDGNNNMPIRFFGANDRPYYYYFKATNSGSFLVLSGASQARNRITKPGHSGLINTSSATANTADMQWTAGSIWFLGTDIDDANYVSVNVPDYNKDDASTDTNGGYGVPYYAPDMSEFGVSPGSTSGVYKTAVFRIRDINSAATTIPSGRTTGVFTVFVDTSDGYVVNTASVGSGAFPNYAGATAGVNYDAPLAANDLNLSEYVLASNYAKAYTDIGTKLELASRNLKLTLPNSAMKAYVTVESTEVTTATTGGDALTVKVGAEGKTTSGTTVKVDSISGVIVTGGDTNAPQSETVVVQAPLAGKDQVVLDTSDPGAAILIGGQKVNRLTRALTDVTAKIAKAGDAVVEKSGNKIVVAGYKAVDTGTAAQQLISWLDTQ